jgi:hypothetical protein
MRDDLKEGKGREVGRGMKAERVINSKAEIRVYNFYLEFLII